MQVAFDALLDGRGVELAGFNAPYSGLEGPTLNALLTRSSGGPGPPPATEAPVRYVHVELGDGTVLACLYSALLLVDGPVCVFVAGSPHTAS